MFRKEDHKKIHHGTCDMESFFHMDGPSGQYDTNEAFNMKGAQP